MFLVHCHVLCVPSSWQDGHDSPLSGSILSETIASALESQNIRCSFGSWVFALSLQGVRSVYRGRLDLDQALSLLWRWDWRLAQRDH